MHSMICFGVVIQLTISGWMWFIDPFCPGLFHWHRGSCVHYDDVIMGTIASQITSLTIVYSTVYSGADQSKHQSTASLAFVWGIDRGPVNSPHKWPVTRKMFPFDDVIMNFPSADEVTLEGSKFAMGQKIVPYRRCLRVILGCYLC